MRFVTDDAGFGLLVAPLPGRDMYRFQMIIASQIVGDCEPGILGSLMWQLRNPPQLTDPRFGQLAEHLADLLPLLRCDQEIHDSTTLCSAESLDQWLINRYICSGTVTFLAIRDGAAANSALISTVPLPDYGTIAGAAYDYWATHRTAQNDQLSASGTHPGAQLPSRSPGRRAVQCPASGGRPVL